MSTLRLAGLALLAAAFVITGASLVGCFAALRAEAATDDAGSSNGADASTLNDTGPAADACADDAVNNCKGKQPQDDAGIDVDAFAWTCPPGVALDAAAPQTFAPSNFDPLTIDASAPNDVDVTDADGSCHFDTDALTLSCAHQSFAYVAARVPHGGGTELAVFATAAFTIEPNVTVDVVGKRALVIDAMGPVNVGGELRSNTLPYPSMSGGSVQITSMVSIVVEQGGLIDVNGQGGVSPEATVCPQPFPGSSGGPGGNILLEAPYVGVAGDLAANGGGSVGVGGCGCGGGAPTSPGVAQSQGVCGGGSGSVGDDPNGTSDGDGGIRGGGAGTITIKAGTCVPIDGILSPTFKSGHASVLPLQ